MGAFVLLVVLFSVSLSLFRSLLPFLTDALVPIGCRMAGGHVEDI
jgi:hypothetical protein